MQLTFSHVSITGHCASLPSCVTDTSRRQADQAHSIFQFRLTMKLEQRDIVVERLTVVIVMDICGCDA